MFKLTLRSLGAHKRRLAGTVVSVVLGVSFLAGNLVLTDTISKTFDELFADVNEGVDAYVRSSTSIDLGFGSAVRGRIDESLVEVVVGVDGVALAAPDVFGFGQIVGADGEPLGNPGMGAPTFAGNWDSNEEFNPFNLVEGRPPEVPGEVVIDRKSSRDGDLEVGSQTVVITQAPDPVAVTVVGIARFGDADSPGGASFALFTTEAAQAVVAEPGKLDGVRVRADDGVSQEELVSRMSATLPDGVEAITGEQLTEENQSDIEEGLSFFSTFLLVFAGIAILVATFSIYNTFSIIVAQRTREMAMLRAIGASRRQVLGSVLAEALAIGVLASVVGLLAGIGVAGLLKGLLAGFGFDVPAGGTVLKSSTVVASLAVGIGITVLAALVPARKASRVPPLAALRDVAVEATRPSRARIVIGAVVTGLGLVSVVQGIVIGGTDGLPAAGFGGVLVVIGFVVLGPVVARPVTGFLGLPLARLRRVTGRLARENAIRNPKRTSGSAAALMIGVAIVSVFTIFAASLKASIDREVQRSFGGDLVVDSGTFGFGGLPPALGEAINELPEVEAAAGLGFGAVNLDGSDRGVTLADPATVSRVMDLDVTEGAIEDLGTSGIAVSTDNAEEFGWSIGTTLPAVFPDGATADLTVGAIFDNTTVIGVWLVPRAAYAGHGPGDFDSVILVALTDGVSIDEGKAAVEEVAGAFANAEVQDRSEFAESQAASVNQILGLVYVMLFLAIFIALAGITNTISLSVHERTRELGLLRAVGMARGQLRATVRWESVLIAVFGAVGGLGLGVLMGWALVQIASEDGFVRLDLPVGQLLVVLLIAALAGVAAGVLPARRAAKLDVLQAIATE